VSDDLTTPNQDGVTEPCALENAARADVASQSTSPETAAQPMLSDVPAEPALLEVPDEPMAPEDSGKPAPSEVSAESASPEVPTEPVTLPGGADPVGEAQPPEGLAGKYDAMRHFPPGESGGIEILIQMAEKGEIDPKNIDIIDVTDRFLRAIAAAPKENLRQSGKIIFQASVLLRMKAEALLAARAAEDNMFGDDDYVEYDEDGMPLIYDSHLEPIARQITLQELERALVRQTKTRQLRHRRVTLEQLIEALRDAERVEKTRGERKVKPTIAVDGYAEMRDMDDILDLAHDEDIEDTITRIENLLVGLLESDNMLPLREIVETMDGGGHWVDVFLGVLFLANAGKISLHQEQFYGPLFVMRSEHLQQVGQSVMVPPAPVETGSVSAY
jgi:segregation and condensation protein A